MARVRRKTSEEVWEMVREAIEGGLPIPRAAERFGIKAESIRTRSKKGRWATPGRVARGDVEPALSEDWQGLPTTGVNATKSQLQQSRVMDTLLARLASLAGQDPKAYQAVLSEIAEAMLATGLADMEPPRTVSEAARLNELIRRNHGFDARASGPAPFINPPRSISRLGPPAIDVETVNTTDPLDGFAI